MMTEEILAAAKTTGRTKSKRVPIIIASIVAAAGIAAGIYFVAGSQPDADKDWRKNTIKVKRSPAQITVLATGLMRPEKEVKISPKQTGLLKQLLVKQGDKVEAGQLIALMDDSNLLGDIEAARGAYLAALDNYSKLKSGNRPQEVAQAKFQQLKAQNAERQAHDNMNKLDAQIKALTAQVRRDETFAERQGLLAAEGAVSSQAKLDAETAATVTRSQLEAAVRDKEQSVAALAGSHAEANSLAEQHDLVRSGFRREDISAAQHNADQAKGQLMRVQSLREDTRIKAPFAGVITQKYTDAGAIVTPTTSSATTSATSSSIVSLSGALEMVAQVSESNIPKISVGQPVEITATAYPDKVFHGKVTQIAPAAIVTQNVTTFEVHAKPTDDKDGQLLAGMNVSAKFVVGRLKNALTVPTVCVISRKGQAGVFVPNAKGEPTFRPVKTGPSVGREIVIVSGLKDNELVFQGMSRQQLTKEGYGSRNAGGGQGGSGSPLRMGSGGGGGGRGMRGGF